MTTRARLLAILKEPGPHGAIPPYAADLNASHRLKRLCEEIAKVPDKWEAAQGIPVDQFQDGAATAAHGIAAAILALGEYNEHS